MNLVEALKAFKNQDIRRKIWAEDYYISITSQDDPFCTNPEDAIAEDWTRRRKKKTYWFNVYKYADGKGDVFTSSFFQTEAHAIETINGGLMDLFVGTYSVEVEL